ncbi:MAG: 5-formyltetrahydrofolate cyclo-ligase [Bdellovibrionales bacterium]
MSNFEKFTSKNEVRQFIKVNRPQALPVLGLYKNLSQVLDSQKGHWAGFKALSDEPPLEGTLPSRIDWYFPVIQGDEMSFAQSEAWTRSPLGVMEPVGGTAKSPQEMDGFLVPGQAFSKKGERIGRGRGCYDRALANTQGLKVGVCFDFQFFTELPSQDHDVRMDVVVTEKEIIWLKR